MTTPCLPSMRATVARRRSSVRQVAGRLAVLGAVLLLLAPMRVRAQAADTTAWRDRPVNVVLVDPAMLRDLRARVILRGGEHEIVTVLLRRDEATDADLLAALGRAQNLYRRTVAPGLVVAADVERTGEARGLDDRRQRAVHGILGRLREQPRQTVAGYGAVQWVRLKSSVLARS